MSQLKYFNVDTQTWEPAIVGVQGPTGPAGADGLDGVDGAIGPTGPAGGLGPTGPAGGLGPTGPAGLDSTVPGPTGDTGPSGVISVTSPITNSGTSTSATIGINQSLINIAQSQVTDLESDLALLAPLASPTFSGTVNVSGDLHVSGTTTTVNTQDIVVADPIVYIGEGNTANIVDLGFVASFDNGTYQHGGLVRDASDNKWKLFRGVIDEPTTTVNFAQATLDNFAVGSIETASLTATSSVDFTGATITGLDLLPSQSGNTGKYLTTNGSVASWATLNATPAFDDLSDVVITSATVNDVAYFNGSAWINKNAGSIPVVINAQAVNSYTAVLADAGKIVEISNATAALFKIPEDADVDYPIGTQIQILQTGVGQVSIVAKTPGSTTVNYTPGNSLRAQWSAATVTKRAANTWVLVGDLA